MTSRRAASLRDYARAIGRRKWLVLGLVVIAPAIAVVLSLQRAPSYRATAQVLVNRQDLSGALSGTPDTGSSDPGRYANTQADLARVPEVTSGTVSAAGASIALSTFLARSSVTAIADSDLLTFEVNDRTAEGAERLVNAYAEAFVDYRRRLDTTALQSVEDDVDARLKALVKAKQQSTPLYRTLSSKQQQLRALQAVQTSHATVVQEADHAEQTQPTPVRDGLLALVLALFLGITIALVREAMQPRADEATDIADALGLPLLARLPTPDRGLRKREEIAMLAAPQSSAAESYRLLRSNLELVNKERRARKIMVVSAAPGDGKSTTVANLAVASSRAGKRVTLVDLDLRAGDIARFFRVETEHGITDIATNNVHVKDALIPVPVSVNGAPPSKGELYLLPAGRAPVEPGELTASAWVAEILADLAERSDLVLVDAPPFFAVGDALSLSSRIDGVVVVVPLGVRYETIDEIGRILDRFAATKLGVVVTHDVFESNYDSGYAPAASSDESSS